MGRASHASAGAGKLWRKLQRVVQSTWGGLHPLSLFRHLMHPRLGSNPAFGGRHASQRLDPWDGVGGRGRGGAGSLRHRVRDAAEADADARFERRMVRPRDPRVPRPRGATFDLRWIGALDGRLRSVVVLAGHHRRRSIGTHRVSTDGFGCRGGGDSAVPDSRPSVGELRRRIFLLAGGIRGRDDAVWIRLHPRARFRSRGRAARVGVFLLQPLVAQVVRSRPLHADLECRRDRVVAQFSSTCGCRVRRR